ncbi:MULTISPECIES: GNAT family N-acetyltransferase [unclassified Streptomyces]|uniref:GNAT family N-acetyltransferase n=1 Tax=unclassified Streptomyces TaxID=2593676 RepID=UPI002DDB0893|nr:GNAT family N-acetyltransferase [Streptomyces sp. NBC_01257]WRZ63104.1 GNAT family N-acetyltransferase [Streptomyces sp. NBC_01257]
MTTATPSPALDLPALRVPASSVRFGRAEDAAELAALSRPFVRSGALRERPVPLYAARAADFVVAVGPGGAIEGCVGLSVYPAGPAAGGVPAGVLYNFCVAGHRQGRGVGAVLLRTALTRARTRSLGALFTATTGGGRLFQRYGFTPAAARLAPRAWADSLDPRRDARILARAV